MLYLYIGSSHFITPYASWFIIVHHLHKNAGAYRQRAIQVTIWAAIFCLAIIYDNHCTPHRFMFQLTTLMPIGDALVHLFSTSSTASWHGHFLLRSFFSIRRQQVGVSSCFCPGCCGRRNVPLLKQSSLMRAAGPLANRLILSRGN